MLPLVETDEQRDTVVPDEAVMRPGVADLCARLGLGGRPLVRFPEGSQPVYAVGDDDVLKLFPAAAAQDGVAEASMLGHLGGRLPVATPELRGAGTYENGWRYVWMSRLRGEGLATAWDGLGRAARERVVTEAGQTLAALHALDPAPLADLLGPGDWGGFVARQRAGAVAQQRERKLPESWVEQIPAFLDGVELPVETRPCLLHTEFMSQHLLIDPADRRLTGLFDFEPAMIGDRAYDFVAVGLFVTRGDPALLARLCRAYGRGFEPAHLLAYTLLHVYSNLPWYLRELPAPPRQTLTALADTWFAAADG
ncbi:aminoglycoside phosphotransferase family protein [Streptomyces sp. NA04227]|uniref:aminoglycoside phosphotransferase family protein n=1 Tax=Streptomyces sp. NA04227 TaxID=2742136 RepID=UPI001590F5B2|nr:aminoglycoside phosphotransferase family protein [Streptomyces sp. NA04227]QKW07230.1 aminoglycoside phosphotransferase family protein [Streptomyces sp. NA04227]